MSYNANSPEVREFVAAYQENQRLAGRPYRIVAENRRKYIAIDEIDGAHHGGRFLIDSETGRVYSIKGYGQRGYPIGNVERMAAEYREASATYNPHSKVHYESSYSRVARTPSTSRFQVIQGGRQRRKGMLRERSRAARRRGQR